MAFWLVKTEPSSYAFADLVAAGSTRWDGVRNAVAQRHLRAMQPGDLVFVYHTGEVKAVVGLARVIAPPAPDPAEPTLAAVELAAERPLARAVTLAELKADPRFSTWELVRLPRLSVMPVATPCWDAVLALAAG